MKFNVKIIASKGGNLCGQDKLSVEACAKCQGQYLYNDELKDVYYDPEDLTRHYFNIPGMSLPPCRYCGDIQWVFDEARPDAQQVQSGPWAWALVSRVFTFSDEPQE